MARFCVACGRPLDAEHHDIGPSRITQLPSGRGRISVRKVRSYGCRVRLTGLTDDRRVHVPDTPQRTALNETSFKHESRF